MITAYPSLSLACLRLVARGGDKYIRLKPLQTGGRKSPERVCPLCRHVSRERIKRKCQGIPSAKTQARERSKGTMASRQGRGRGSKHCDRPRRAKRLKPSHRKVRGERDKPKGQKNALGESENRRQEGPGEKTQGQNRRIQVNKR